MTSPPAGTEPVASAAAAWCVPAIVANLRPILLRLYHSCTMPGTLAPVGVALEPTRRFPRHNRNARAIALREVAASALGSEPPQRSRLRADTGTFASTEKVDVGRTTTWPVARRAGASPASDNPPRDNRDAVGWGYPSTRRKPNVSAWSSYFPVIGPSLMSLDVVVFQR